MRFWRAEQLRALELLLEDAYRGWVGDWGLPGRTELRVNCRHAGASDACNDAGTAFRGPGAALAWFRDGSREAAVQALLFDVATRPGSVADDVARACSADVMRRLALALGMSGAEPERAAAPALPVHPWGGEVCALLPFEGVLLLNGEAASACVARGETVTRVRGGEQPRFPSATPLLDAASERRVLLQAQLASCEVDLGLLQELQPGDVLRIPHRLDVPVQVRVEGGGALFSGYLARSGGRKAIELVAA